MRDKASKEQRCLTICRNRMWKRRSHRVEKARAKFRGWLLGCNFQGFKLRLPSSAQQDRAMLAGKIGG